MTAFNVDNVAQAVEHIPNCRCRCCEGKLSLSGLPVIKGQRIIVINSTCRDCYRSFNLYFRTSEAMSLKAEES